MNFLKATLLNLCLLLIVNICLGQEKLIPLQGNPVLMQYAKDHPAGKNREKSISAALHLPFMDDFSTSYVYPDSSKWMDKWVYINTDYPINPPTIGVATFDGLDSIGRPYMNSNVAYGADTLTSKPIDLQSINSSDSSVYLSFFYQPGGLGLPPDPGDSLLLQFRYNTSDTGWVTVWGVDGNSSDTAFKQVFIHVWDTIYFYNGFAMDTIRHHFYVDSFQFRFMNYVSGYGCVDLWHLDYVYLDQNRTNHDTTMLDMAFVYKAPSFLKTFCQMPWSHFLADSANQIAHDYSVVIRNNDINDHFVLYRTNLYDYTGTNQLYNWPFSGTGGFLVNSLHNDTLAISTSTGTPQNFDFPNVVTPYAEFDVTHSLVYTSGDINKGNDTIKSVQRFIDFYAYDDGTAEAGYGLENFPGAELAYKFTTTKDDSLVGVYMFFTQAVQEVSLHLFSLVIWSSITPNSNTDVPIYKKFNQHPRYDTTGINKFYYYSLDSADFGSSKPLLTAGTYYIGWIQDDGTNLGVGIDLNTAADTSKLWYNTNGSWYQSSIPGSLMIRPVFGSSLDVGINNNDNLLANSIDIYPNPANDKVIIQWKNITLNKNNDLKTEVFDPMGRLLISKVGYQKIIDVSNVNEGFYLLKMSDMTTGNSFTRKFVINR